MDETAQVRLPPLSPADLDPEQRELYDAITGGPRAAGAQAFPLTDADGSLTGPFSAMLLAPPVGHAVQQVGAAIRYRATLPDRMRELAILAVAAQWDSAFERYAHEPLARAAGATEDEIAALRDSSLPESVDDAERAALELVFALLRDGDVDDSTYARGVDALGPRAVFELSTIVGYYALLALQLRLFRVSVPS